MAELLIAKGDKNRAWQYANDAAKKATNAKEEARAAILQQFLFY